MKNYLLHSARILTIDESSKMVLSQWHISSEVIGDPRIDTIHDDLSRPPVEVSQLIDFFIEKNVIVFGSSHEEDEELILLILPTLREWGFNTIIAPHHIERSSFLTSQINKSVLLSNLKYPNKVQCIIIDKIGILKYLYQTASISYVGGGMTAKVHNILESLIAGSVTCFGPFYKNSGAAIEWSKVMPNSIIKTKDELLDFIKESSTVERRNQFDEKRKLFLNRKKGASLRALSAINKFH